MQPGVLLKRVQSRLTPEMRRKFQYGWEFLNFGVLGLNSFVLLYLHSARSSIQAVVCAGMAGYALVLLLQIFLCRSRPHPRRLELFRRTKKVFRLLYTAIYLTAIMLDIFAVSQRPDAAPLLACYGVLFCWVILWGTNCFWGIALWRRVRPVVLRTVRLITGQAPTHTAENGGDVPWPSAGHRIVRSNGFQEK